MNCKNCNAAMTIDTENKKFICPYCHSVEPFDNISKEEIQQLLKEALRDANQANQEAIRKMMAKQQQEIELARTESTAKSAATYVVLTVAAAFTFIMMLFGYSTEYKVVGVVSMLQFALIVVAILTKAIAKEEKSKRLVIASNVCTIAAALLVIPWFIGMAMPSDDSNKKTYLDDIYARDYYWPKEGYAAAMPRYRDQPDYSYVGDREAKATLLNMTEDDYNAYIEQCKKDGFDIDVTAKNKEYNAYNADDQEINVNYISGEKTVYVKLYDAIEFSSPLVWPTQGVMKEVPKPDSDSAFIETMSGDFFKAYIDGMSQEKFMDYVQLLMEQGFDGRYSGGNTFYCDKGEASVSLELKRNRVLQITVH